MSPVTGLEILDATETMASVAPGPVLGAHLEVSHRLKMTLSSQRCSYLLSSRTCWNLLTLVCTRHTVQRPCCYTDDLLALECSHLARAPYMIISTVSQAVVISLTP